MSGGKRIGLREVRALGTDQIIWDNAVAGFGARRRSGTAVVYIVNSEPLADGSDGTSSAVTAPLGRRRQRVRRPRPF